MLACLIGDEVKDLGEVEVFDDDLVVRGLEKKRVAVPVFYQQFLRYLNMQYASNIDGPYLTAKAIAEELEAFS